MAEGIFRQMAREAGAGDMLVCQSAGLSAVEGGPVSPEAALVCGEIGVDISGHRARRITGEELPVWDVFFPMSKTHGYILERAGAPPERIYIPRYIADPFGQGPEAYRACRDKLRGELAVFYGELAGRLGLPPLKGG